MLEGRTRTRNGRNNGRITKIITNLKSPGENGLPVKTSKEGGKEVESRIVALNKNIQKQAEISNDWRMDILCPIFKKGDITNSI